MYWDKITSLDRESTLATKIQAKEEMAGAHETEREGGDCRWRDRNTGSMETLSSRSESGDSDRRSYIQSTGYCQTFAPDFCFLTKYVVATITLQSSIYNSDFCNQLVTISTFERKFRIEN